MAKQSNKHLQPQIAKITINIGVGEAGERLKKAESVLESVTKQKPVETISTVTSKEWALRKMMPIGCKVTLRKEKADTFLKEALKTREHQIGDFAFDKQGNLSFGVADHTLFEGQKYDPNIGIFGMDVCITMEKPGHRTKKRRVARRKVPHRHRVTREETMQFMTDNYKVEIVQ